MATLIGRKLKQSVTYTHCWWSWGQFDEEKGKWTGAVGKVLYDDADIAVNSLDIREDRQVLSRPRLKTGLQILSGFAS